MQLFAVLRFVNEYDQQGGYIVGVYDTREAAVASIDHEGRTAWEYEWFGIQEMELNKDYQNDDDYAHLHGD